MVGLLGWLTAPQLGSIDVRLLQPLRQLAAGEDSGLLRLESGLWMVKLLEQREATAMSFEQAREQMVEVHRQTRIETLQAAVRNRHLAENESGDCRESNSESVTTGILWRRMHQRGESLSLTA